MYFMSECLSTHSKPSWLNDYDRGEESQGHRAASMLETERALQDLYFSKAFSNIPTHASAPPAHTWAPSLPQRAHGNTVLRSGLILPRALYLYQSFMAETPLLIWDQCGVLFYYPTPAFSFPITEGSRARSSGV